MRIDFERVRGQIRDRGRDTALKNITVAKTEEWINPEDKGRTKKVQSAVTAARFFGAGRSDVNTAVLLGYPPEDRTLILEQLMDEYNLSIEDLNHNFNIKTVKK